MRQLCQPTIDLLTTEVLLVAQWLEHPTSVRKVVGSIPIWKSESFFVLFSPHISCNLLFLQKNVNNFEILRQIFP